MHPYIPELKELYRKRRISRRELLRNATLLGLSAFAAKSFVAEVAHAEDIQEMRLERAMHEMTASNLKSAFSGESQAHMRYLIYGDKAEKDGFPNVARLFQAIAYAEQVHATNHFQQLRDDKGPSLTAAVAGFGLGPTAENLEVAIEGEEFEIAEMYPVYKAAAELQGETGAVRSFDWAWQAEQIHAAMYKEAKAAVEAGKDYDIGPIYICPFCGHTVEGEAPDRCPVCNAKREKYKEFS